MEDKTTTSKLKWENNELSISETLFGIDRDRGNAMAEEAVEIMKSYERDDEPDSADDVKKYWHDMYAEIVTLGKTENERLWLTFTFSTQYAKLMTAHDLNGVREKVMKLLVLMAAKQFK